MLRLFFLLSCLLLLISSSSGQEKKLTLLDEGFYFYPILLDPTESLTSAAVFSLWEKDEDRSGVYVPVNIAFGQSLIRYRIDSISGWEFGMQAAAFTQFEIKPVGGGTYLGGMMNVDYRATGFVNYHHNQFSIRFRVFHISSHLADDYIIRNDITEPTPNTLNYEQVDLTLAHNKGPLRLYGQIGYIFTPNSVRERFSTQLGFQLRQIHREENFVRLLGGLDIKIFEENNYSPNYRAGVGVELGQTTKTYLAILLDFYRGNLPYSTLEYKEVTWLGITSVVMPKFYKP